MVKINQVKVKNLVTPSKLPGADFVINPYVGCTNACRYCYASFMKRFTDHPEPWGEFLDVKICDKPIDTKKLIGKSIFISSVTDAYNDYEKEYQKTRDVLKQLVGVDCRINISTKNELILRDLDLLTQMKNLIVDFSINTASEDFKNDMDKASAINVRFAALKILHQHGIKTAVFVSPMFPELCDYKEIIKLSKDFVDEYWFENLNLRGDYKYTIFGYIKRKHPHFFPLYDKIYNKNQTEYWDNLMSEIKEFCKTEGVKMRNYFHHEQIRK